MNKRAVILVSSVFGLTGVAIGAFGAHALRDMLISNGYIETFKTASFYHISHALALLVIGVMMVTNQSAWLRRSATFFSFGIVLFSGSLYLLSISGIRWIGAITPLGGLSLMVGWVMLTIYAYTLKS